MYAEFVGAVAEGRGLSEDAVGEIAQGRVWMGGDAVENGLCDGFGTLSDAIALARAEAGVPQWRKVQVVEYPPRRSFQMPNLLGLPSFTGLGTRLGAWLEPALVSAPEDLPEVSPGLLPGLGATASDYVRRIGHAPGEPLLVVPPELVPRGWRDLD